MIYYFILFLLFRKIKSKICVLTLLKSNKIKKSFFPVYFYKISNCSNVGNKQNANGDRSMYRPLTFVNTREIEDKSKLSELLHTHLMSFTRRNINS